MQRARASVRAKAAGRGFAEQRPWFALFKLLVEKKDPWTHRREYFSSSLHENLACSTTGSPRHGRTRRRGYLLVKDLIFDVPACRVLGTCEVCPQPVPSVPPSLHLAELLGRTAALGWVWLAKGQLVPTAALAGGGGREGQDEAT